MLQGVTVEARWQEAVHVSATRLQEGLALRLEGDRGLFVLTLDAVEERALVDALYGAAQALRWAGDGAERRSASPPPRRGEPGAVPAQRRRLREPDARSHAALIAEGERAIEAALAEAHGEAPRKRPGGKAAQGEAQGR